MWSRLLLQNLTVQKSVMDYMISPHLSVQPIIRVNNLHIHTKLNPKTSLGNELTQGDFNDRSRVKITRYSATQQFSCQEKATTSTSHITFYIPVFRILHAAPIFHVIVFPQRGFQIIMNCILDLFAFSLFKVLKIILGSL